jgi:quercetin dioxygenase-like cupin family protein
MNDNFEKSRIYKLKNAISYSDGAIVSKIIVKNDIGNVTLFAFDCGQGLSEHTAPFDAVVQIIEGSARISINKEHHILHESDMIIMPAAVPHAVEAYKQFKMILTMIKN